MVLVPRIASPLNAVSILHQAVEDGHWPHSPHSIARPAGLIGSFPPQSCEGRYPALSECSFPGAERPEVAPEGVCGAPPHSRDDPWATKKGSVLLSGPRQPEVGKSPVTAHCALCCRGYLVVLPLYVLQVCAGAIKAPCPCMRMIWGRTALSDYARTVIFSTSNPFSVCFFEMLQSTPPRTQEFVPAARDLLPRNSGNYELPLRG